MPLDEGGEGGVVLAGRKLLEELGVGQVPAVVYGHHLPEVVNDGTERFGGHGLGPPVLVCLLP
jgi:hypothetical protein